MAEPGSASDWVLRVEKGRHRVTLVLAADPAGARPALAHGAGHALWHLDRSLEPPLREGVLRLARSFAGGARGASTREVAGWLSGELARIDPGAHLEVKGVLPRREVMPRWPAWLKIGVAGPGPGGPWPFDSELAAFRLGRRRLIKRDGLAAVESDAQAAWLSESGLRVRVCSDSTGAHRVVFAAADEAILGEAIGAEQVLSEKGPRADQAARWLGTALGYPACCVDAFVRLGRADDGALGAALLPAPGAPPASALSQWLVGPLALVSHAPCALTCAATLALARVTLAELERTRPGFEPVWRSLASRVVAIDEEGRSFALQVDGALAGGRVRGAIEICPTAASTPEVMRPAPSLVGLELALADGSLVSASGRWRAALAADHRREVLRSATP
jgi:hypothetical protein